MIAQLELLSGARWGKWVYCDILSRFDVMKGVSVALRHNYQMLLTFPTALPEFFSPACYFAPETLGDINK